MKMTRRSQLVVGLLGAGMALMLGATSCERDATETPTTPETTAVGNFAQRGGASTTFDLNGATHQLNVAPGIWSGFPFGEWWYLEINQQERAGLRPGQRQEAVTLDNPTLTLENLPDGVTAITAGVAPDGAAGASARADEKMTELTTFVVKNGRVDMKIETSDWMRRFGRKQWALWFKTTGGQNFIGLSNVRLTLRGKLANGSHAKITFVVTFGVNPEPTPAPAPNPVGYTCKGKTYSMAYALNTTKNTSFNVTGPGGIAAYTGGGAGAVVGICEVNFYNPTLAAVETCVRDSLGIEGFGSFGAITDGSFGLLFAQCPAMIFW